jgi:excisionase family DNA binding protein
VISTADIDEVVDLDRLPPMLTVGQVSKIFQVRPEKVRAMLAAGTLPGIRLGPRGDWRVPKSAVAKFADAPDNGGRYTQSEPV